MIAVLLFIYGLIIGSFLNAYVWRRQKKRDWVRERSECTHCHHVLAPKDLVPVLSWVWLRGKCRYCRKKIDDSPLTELGLGLAFSLSFIFWPYSLSSAFGIGLFVLWLVILGLFAVMCIYDFRWFLLPDIYTYSLMPLAGLFAFLRVFVDSHYSLLGALVGGALFFGVFYALYQGSKGDWIGGGDVKLALPLGVLAGSAGGMFLALFGSSLLGTLFALPLIVRHKRLSHLRIPYGPFLLLATVLTVLGYQYVYAWLFAPFYTPFP